jgi:hypothetical protein
LLPFAILLTLPMAAAAQAPAAAPASIWSVADFGATPDGTTDNTAAFQKALDRAGQAGGGVVNIPAGRYRFDGSLTIPREVALRGVSGYALSHAGIRDQLPRKGPKTGTVLLPCANAGNTKPPRRSFWYNPTRPAGPVHPLPQSAARRPHPDAVPLCRRPARQQPRRARHRNCSTLQRHRRQQQRPRPDPQCPRPAAAHRLYVDAIYDIGRIENVHWNPWWSMQRGLFEWQKQTASASSSAGPTGITS